MSDGDDLWRADSGVDAEPSPPPTPTVAASRPTLPDPASTATPSPSASAVVEFDVDFDGADRAAVPDISGSPWNVRRLTVAAGAIVALAIAATIWRVVSDDATEVRPEVTLAAADPRRVPTEVNELWSARIPAAGTAKSSEVFVHERDLVVAVIDDGSRARGAIVGLNAGDGTLRWRRSFSFAPEEFRLLGSLDGALIVQQSDVSQRRRLLALDLDDGTTRWELPAADGGLYSILVGTDVVTRLPTVGSGDFQFISPTTGEVIGRVDGSIAATDLDGGWYFWSNSNLVRVDLAAGTEANATDRSGASIGPIPVDVVASAAGFTSDAVVVDGRVVSIGADGELRELQVDAPARPIRVTGEAGRLVLDELIPVGADRFVIRAGGTLFGADLGVDEIGDVWRREASAVAVVPTESGVVMLLENTDSDATRLDDEYVVIDAVSGESLGQINVPRNDVVEPFIVGNGFVIRRELVDGEELSGFDLAGEPLWTLDVDGRIQLGDEIVASLVPDGDAYVITAYG